MFLLLTNAKRIMAGHVLALAYLFCVLAPGMALGFGSSAPWLQHDLKPAAAAHQHDHSAQDFSHAHGAVDGDHRADGTGDTGHQHDGKAGAGPCCAMLCLSAMAADLPAIAKPAQPKSVRVAENYRRLPDKMPAQRYRPPIA
jgi:hypothetical protein